MKRSSKALMKSGKLLAKQSKKRKKTLRKISIRRSRNLSEMMGDI